MIHVFYSLLVSSKASGFIFYVIKERQILHQLKKLIFYFPYLSYRHEENVVILQIRKTLFEFVICRVFNLISISCINWVNFVSNENCSRRIVMIFSGIYKKMKKVFDLYNKNKNKFDSNCIIFIKFTLIFIYSVCNLHQNSVNICLQCVIRFLPI